MYSKLLILLLPALPVLSETVGQLSDPSPTAVPDCIGPQCSRVWRFSKLAIRSDDLTEGPDASPPSEEVARWLEARWLEINATRTASQGGKPSADADSNAEGWLELRSPVERRSTNFNRTVSPEVDPYPPSEEVARWLEARWLEINATRTAPQGGKPSADADSDTEGWLELRSSKTAPRGLEASAAADSDAEGWLELRLTRTTPRGWEPSTLANYIEGWQAPSERRSIDSISQADWAEDETRQSESRRSVDGWDGADEYRGPPRRRFVHTVLEAA